MSSLEAPSALLFAMALKRLRYLMPPPITEGLKPIFERAFEALEGNEALHTKFSHSYRDWMKKVAVVPDSLPYETPPIDETAFETVSRALFEEKKLVVKYTPADSKKVLEALVSPLGIVQQEERFFLLCQAEGDEEIFSIALNHIIAARPTTFDAKKPAGFDLWHYLMCEKAFNYGYGREIELTFEFSSRLLKRILTETPLRGRDQELQTNTRRGSG